MVPFKRYITDQVNQDLQRKMVFIGGPRQVGKTTFAANLRKKADFLYLNWDIDEHRTKRLSEKSYVALSECKICAT